MDFFDFLFGKKKDDNAEKQTSSNVTSEKCEPVANPVRPSMDPVEQYVKESVANLKQHTTLNTKELEAEAIYLAAFLYLKGSYQIDFELDYFSDGLINNNDSVVLS